MQPEVVLKIDALDNTKAALSSVKKNLGEVEKSTKGFRDRVQSMQPAFQRMAIGGGAAFAAIGYGIKQATGQAVSLGESVNAVNVVFGNGADAILKYGEQAATAVGLANSEFNQMSTVTGALLKDTGLSMQGVADQTIALTERAADMASVFNTSVADAMSAINQALRGETEAIRRYAGDVTDATLEQYLLSQGINRSAAELSEQEKRLYRVELIMKQTADTAGDFQRTTDSLANQQRILGAQFKDIAATLGEQFIPIIQDVLSKVRPVIDRFAQWAENNPKLARNLVIAAAAVAGITAALGALGLAILPIIAAFKTAAIVIAAVTSPIGLVVAAIAAALFVGHQISKQWERFPLIIKALLYPLKLLYDTFIFLGEAMSWVFGKVFSIAEAKMSNTQSKIVDLQGTVDKFTDPLAGQSMMVEDFGGSIKNMGGEATKAADKLKQLREEAAGIFTNIDEQEAESKRELAEAIVEQEDSIADKKDELRRLEREENSETNAQRIQSLRETIAEEERALRSAKDLRLGLRQEIAEAERRADLTAFERQIEDIQRRRLARLQAQVARLQEIQKEIAAEKMKNNAITRSFVSAQETMQSAVKETREVAEKEAEKMKEAFDSAVRSMSRLRSSTSVSMSTPSIVRNVDDAVISPRGDIISTHPDDYLIATKEPGELAGAGGGITINISGTFMDDREAARRMGGEIMRTLQQQMRLS